MVFFDGHVIHISTDDTFYSFQRGNEMIEGAALYELWHLWNRPKSALFQNIWTHSALKLNSVYNISKPLKNGRVLMIENNRLIKI